MKGTLPLLGLAIVLGCSPDTGPMNPEDQVKVLSNPIEKPADLMPMKSGNAWTYTLRATERNTSGQGRELAGNPTLKVTGQDGSKVTVAFVQENKLVSELLLTTNANGVVQRGIRAANGPTRTYTPAIPMYYWPMKPGETRDWKGEGFRVALGDLGPITSTLEYKGESDVDTPAGRMKAHRFDTTSIYKKGETELGSTQSFWLVPKVGIARSVEITVTGEVIRETEMKLQSYTVK
jgi:hypothetical protein